jgi:hypothetical protein
MLRYDAVQLFDLGFGLRLVSVTPPGCPISSRSKLHPKHRGKAPGMPTESGWIGVDVNDPQFRCPDYATAKLWRDDWMANVGFVLGDGFLAIDNDQGREFSDVLRRLLPNAPRRYVFAPGHERDAFPIHVVDFIGEGVIVPNRTLKFRKGVAVAEIQILAQGKQFVVAGVHPGTRGPYVWDRELEGPDQVPVFSVDQFNAFISEFCVELEKLDWVLVGPGPAAGQRESPRKTPKGGPTDATLTAGLAALKALLDEIPNRDIPPGETPNAIDRWLDDYINWTRVGYASAAFVGPEVAATPDALQVWCAWSDGRAQSGQTSESVWRSVLNQPLRYGGAGLLRLVRSLVRASVDDFPDIAPDDPMILVSTPVWEALRERWLFCAVKGFVDIKTGVALRRQAFSDKHAKLAGVLDTELFPGRRGKYLPVADQFLSQPDRMEVSDVTYAPGDPILIPAKDLPVFNFWRGPTLLTRDVAVGEVKPWLDHLLFVLGSEFERDRFLRWCAFVIQYPQFKPNWHYLIMSLQGLGKDTMVAPIKVGVGENNWDEQLIYQVADNFNDVVEHKFLIIGETAQPNTGLTTAHDLGTRLKPLLAQPPTHLTVNKKNMTRYKIANRLAVILFSNEPNPLQLERGQRRVHVVNRRGAKAEPTDYYWTLQQWLSDGGAELAAAYLARYPLSELERREFIGGVAPASDDKTELEHLNIHPALSALEELLADAGRGVGKLKDLVATQSQIAERLVDDVRLRPSSQLIRTWLLDMERRKTGVHRLKIDPEAKHLAGLVGDGKHSGRLWLLGEKAPDGRAWSDMTVTEIIALWKNLPPPRNATVHRHPAAQFPDEEEPV